MSVSISDKYYYMAKGEMDFAIRRQITFFFHVHTWLHFKKHIRELYCNVQVMAQLKARVRVSIAGLYYILLEKGFDF